MNEKQTKFSYSRISQYESCPYSYNLKYNLKKFVDPPSLITYLGALIHYIEEQIGRSLLNGTSPNYKDLINQLYEINIPKKDCYDTEGDIFGINILQNQFKRDFFAPSSKTGMNYATKIEEYVKNIKRQEQFLVDNPHLEIFGLEKPFEFNFEGFIMKGRIDRILKYKNKPEYQIYDIKTRDRLFLKNEVTTPLQHVIYGLALTEILNLASPPTEYFYDMVFLQTLQVAGTKGFISRGEKKLRKLLTEIQQGEYPPSPSPLCYYCPFSNTNPNVTEDGANECPYYSFWTPNNKVFEVKNAWKGDQYTPILIAQLKEENKNRFRNFLL